MVFFGNANCRVRCLPGGALGGWPLGGRCLRRAARWCGAVAFGFSAALAVLPPSPAEAHQWYPKKCCNDQDCFPAERVTRLEDGGLEIRAGPVRVIVPRGFEARASQDERVHVCVWRDGMGKYHARCLFLPGIG